jgi:hypothetical protein
MNEIPDLKIEVYGDNTFIWIDGEQKAKGVLKVVFSAECTEPFEPKIITLALYRDEAEEHYCFGQKNVTASGEAETVSLGKTNA